MRFVVDRRPSKSFITDAYLQNISEAATTNATSEMACDANDVEVFSKHHKQSKRRRSDSLQDQNVEFSSTEMKTLSSAQDTSDKEHKSVRERDRDGKKKRRERKEYVEEIIGGATEESDRDKVTRDAKERKTHRSLVDVSSRKSHMEQHVENQLEQFAVVSGNESPPRSVGMPHHSGKKSGKNGRDNVDGWKSSVDGPENRDDERYFSGPGDRENIERPSPPASQKRHHKKRSEISAKETFSSPSQTSRKDASMAWSATPAICEKTKSASGGVSSTEVVKLPSRVTSECGKEMLPVVQMPHIQGSESEGLFELVTQDDDNTGKVDSGSGDMQFRISSTPPREGAKSPFIGFGALNETGVDSPLKKGVSSQSCFDPHVILESPIGRKSPSKTTRLSTDVDDQPSSVDDDNTGQITARSAESPQLTVIRSLLVGGMQSSLSTDISRAAPAVDVSLPVISVTEDIQDSSAALVKKNKAAAHGRENSVSDPVSESHSTLVNRQSGTERPVADVSDRVDESCLDDSLSPELPIIGSVPPARRTRAASKQRRITSRQSDQPTRPSYTLRTRRSTADSMVEPLVPVPDLGQFLTPPGNARKGSSDIDEFHSDAHERPHKFRVYQSGREGDTKGGTEANSSAFETDSDYSLIFPLPSKSEIAQICTELELPMSDGGKDSDAKEDDQISSRLRSRSGTDKVSNTVDKPVSGSPQKKSSESKSVVGTDIVEVPEEPEKPVASRLRSRTSESKADVETGTDVVLDTPDRQLSKKRRSEIKSGGDDVVLVEPRSDVLEDSPVSSHLRNKSATDVIDAPSTGCLAGSPKKSSPHRSNTMPTVLSSESEVDSKTAPVSSHLRKKSAADCKDLPPTSSVAVSPKKPSPNRFNTAPMVLSSESELDSHAGPVSSHLRNKSAADDKNLPSTSFVAGSPKKTSSHPSNTKPTVLSSDSEIGSQAECSQPEKSSSASAGPLTSENIYRLSDGASLPVTISPSADVPPKSSRISSPGSPWRSAYWHPRRASFQLVVNLKSPKSDRKKCRLSSCTSLEDAEYWSDRLNRSLSPDYSSSKEGRRSSSLTPTRSQQPSSDHKLRRRRPRRDFFMPENATRRSLRLRGFSSDMPPGLISPAKATTDSHSTPTRLLNDLFSLH